MKQEDIISVALPAGVALSAMFTAWLTTRRQRELLQREEETMARRIKLTRTRRVWREIHWWVKGGKAGGTGAGWAATDKCEEP